MLSVANLGGKNDYPELGSRYKGCHIKILVFWKAIQSQKFSDDNADETWVPVGSFFFRVTTKKRFDIWEHHHMDTGSKLLLYRVGPQIDLSPQV